MQEFHYVRIFGEDGGVDWTSGIAAGVALDEILEAGLPPWRVALEIIAGLCEILDIAEADEKVHGDVSTRFVFLDEEGAISLEGFGVGRRSPVPRADPTDTATDLYGLGRVALRLLSDRPLQRLNIDDPEAHEEAILEAVVDLDVQGLPENMQGDVQWYVAKWLSHDPAERPSALESWRTFIAFAATVPGPSLDEWAKKALDGGGERRAGNAARSASDAEVLTGAKRAEGPLSQGLRGISPGPSSGGGTAFWSKEEMKEAVRRPSGGTEDRPPMGVGGGSATNFWRPDQLAAMADDPDAAPKPRRARDKVIQRSESEIFRRRREERVQRAAPDRQAIRRRSVPVQSPERSPPADRGPARRAEPARSSSGGVPVTTSVVIEKKADNRATTVIAIVGVGMVLLLLLLLVVAVIAVGAAVWLYTTKEAASVPASVDPVAVEVPVAEPLQVGRVGRPDPGPDPRPSPEPELVEMPPPVNPGPATPRPAAARPPSPSPRPSPRVSPPRPRPVAEPPPRPAPVARAAPPVVRDDARVRLISSSSGTVSGCADTRVAFDRSQSFTVEGYRLPMTCLVKIGDARGTFQVAASGEITCDVADGAVVCEPKELR